MKLSLGLKVGTSLSLTPQLQQAIRLLQLSTLELEQEIQTQLDSNPLLELVEDANTISIDANEFESAEREQRDLGEQMACTQLGEDLPVDTQWDDVYTHQSTALATPEYEEREDNRSHHESIWEHLRWQLNVAHLSPIDQVIAACMVDGIDERGYLIATLDEILEAAQQHLSSVGIDPDEIEPADVEVVLKRIQNLEPAGVGARDLAECLVIQLRLLPEETPDRASALLLMQHHDLLTSNDVIKLMRITQLTQDQLRQALQLIKSLDPYPGLRYQDAEQDHQVPDVVVRKKDQSWEVLLNTDILPKLRVNPYYAGMVKRADTSADNQYLRQHMQDARNFIKSVDERHKTLLKVATCIVEHQRAFLEYGPEAMKPLILRDIADETELHESTVSRVTTQKFMLTPRGLFELKYFFSSHVGTSTGGECSSTAIRAMIKKMVQEENPRKPLSDNTIAEKLQAEGIDVARRTVAKYRESLNIPSSSERKRLL